MKPTEVQKTLSQKIADESAKAPVVFDPENDKELDKVKANYPRASSVTRDERGTIIIKH